MGNLGGEPTSLSKSKRNVPPPLARSGGKYSKQGEAPSSSKPCSRTLWTDMGGSQHGGGDGECECARKIIDFVPIKPFHAHGISLVRWGSPGRVCQSGGLAVDLRSPGREHSSRSSRTPGRAQKRGRN
ncbi:hypothetical protein ZHAS_00010516 [Anopheles sinensis]|uniref:Uncharacterized protein n=1 Tax=Anopheles sinensis TaxID=74873 RepID=A0A084VXS6_ANOSI|nr:hypothetical protein ZHAS_00010516 [Anopheles sinensis]